ncbi:MAG: haloacid dehalogenase-like hydrolase [Olsenella sp.]|nr:haloacid dehalogenase-like hydrolase [Olsenella sp.]
MNVYDFDGTIFHSNCTVGFGLWCIRRHPGLLFSYGPRVLWSFVLYKLGKMPNYRMQRELFRYLTMIDDFDEQIELYWDAHEAGISPWYLEQKRSDDLIMSSSPTCIIGPIARRLGVNYAATDYDRELGVLLDNLMYAREKARYIFDHGFPVIENFYSDSLSDTPLALCAEKAHLVTNGGTTVVDWPELDPKTAARVKKEIDTGWKIHLSEDA